MSEVKILAQPAPDPDVCRFLVDQPVLPGTSRSFNSKEEAESSPLAKLLFDLDFVAAVRLRDDAVVVTKKGEKPWQEAGKLVGGAIRAHVQSGQPAVELAADDEDLEQRVVRILKEQINPGLAGHGGFVDLAKVKDNVVYVTLGGGCQGCAMSQMTLKQGIETKLKEQVPEVISVVDVTDHASGQNAYFK